MIRKACTNFVNFICENNYSNEDKEAMDYVLRIIIFEFLKIVGNLVLFFLLNHFSEALIIMMTISLIKPFIGGYHCDTQFRCFLLTFIINIFIIILSNKSTLDFTSICIIIFTSLISIYNQAPIINENMPLTKYEFIKRNRKRGFFSLTIISLATIISFFYFRYYSYILTWTLLSLAILMFNKLSWKKILDNF